MYVYMYISQSETLSACIHHQSQQSYPPLFVLLLHESFLVSHRQPVLGGAGHCVYRHDSPSFSFYLGKMATALVV